MIHSLPANRRVYFASDFHLGAPSVVESHERERRLLRWLDYLRDDAAALVLIGDIFDFWFEYRYVVPKGGVRLLGKLAELSDAGLPVYIFTGNHDMWMRDYLTEEIGATIYHRPQRFEINGVSMLVGHGDGLGPGDRRYKVLKKIFRHPAAQWLFSGVPSRVGMGVAHAWSRRSREDKADTDAVFLGEDEWLLAYCRRKETEQHHDYYIFGHRHLPLDLTVGPGSQYINTGEWITGSSYAVFDGQAVHLQHFEAVCEPAG